MDKLENRLAFRNYKEIKDYYSMREPQSCEGYYISVLLSELEC